MFPVILWLTTVAGAFGHMAHGYWVTGYHGGFMATPAQPKSGPIVIVHYTVSSTLYAMRHGYECTRAAISRWNCTPSQIG